MSAYGDHDYDAGEPDDKALEAARMEAQVFGRGTGYGVSGPGSAHPDGETPKQTLRRLFEENSAGAAMRLISLSTHASSERVRLDASKYIVERVLGPLAGAGAAVGANGDAEPGSLEHTLAEMEKNVKNTGH